MSDVIRSADVKIRGVDLLVDYLYYPGGPPLREIGTGVPLEPADLATVEVLSVFHKGEDVLGILEAAVIAEIETTLTVRHQ